MQRGEKSNEKCHVIGNELRESLLFFHCCFCFFFFWGKRIEENIITKLWIALGVQGFLMQCLFLREWEKEGWIYFSIILPLFKLPRCSCGSFVIAWEIFLLIYNHFFFNFSEWKGIQFSDEGYATMIWKNCGIMGVKIWFCGS